MEEMEIEIDRAGKVTMRTKGVKGAACMEMADLVARLVGREESRRMTREYFEGAEGAVRRQEVRSTGG